MVSGGACTSGGSQEYGDMSSALRGEVVNYWGAVGEEYGSSFIYLMGEADIAYVCC